MSHEAQMKSYLRRVRSSLLVRRRQRRRVLEELENHLDEGAAAHEATGTTRIRAIALVIEELGPPETVAAAFNDEAIHTPDRSSVLRWLPMLLPVFVFTESIGFLVWTLTWLSGGLTAGEQVALRAHLRTAVIAGLLSFFAFVSIRRARRDRAWRWAAWLCTGCVLVVFAPW
ncbi:MAG: hypothetical protein QOD72_3149 [Acidimicrobiaceae bacterium]|jgi:hypothetical protein|nr:hypothetical protein [Acidimicrobiaceae bacterium]